MKSFDEVNLSEASQSYAVANTPLFLLRRLQENPSVYGISTSFTGEEILQEFQKVVAHAPETLLEYTKPYAYLVALSKLPDSRYLKAVEVKNAEKWRWLGYMKEVLLETYSPLSTANVLGEVARLSPSNADLTHSGSPNGSSQIILEN